MAMLVWAMMGLALWHFTIFLPDRFWGGIVGAFLGALFGGQTLKDFGFALLVGVASGAYSSIFIASPVLTHWKEREPVYVRRRRRIAEANGGTVPAYATAVGGAPVDVAPEEKVRRRDRITQPDDPQRGVSQDEFDEMVRDLHADAPAPRTATAEREPEPEPEPDRAADLAPEDLVLKDDKAKRAPKQRRPRNRRHGRSR